MVTLWYNHHGDIQFVLTKFQIFKNVLNTHNLKCLVSVWDQKTLVKHHC